MAKERHRVLPAFLAGRQEQGLVPGEAEFQNYGCGGCHKIGFEAGGPDLTDVTIRRSKDWIKAWVMNPEAYYDDPSIVALINHFGVRMPNQHVTDADAEKIMTYLDAQRSKPADTEAGKAGDNTATDPGEAIYKKMCFACHTAGVGGAPVLGDKAAWAPRISQGEQTLYEHALSGFQGKTGFMPPKGGCSDCSNDEVKAAVDYMKAQSQ
jgi:cytochrome c5